MMMRYGTCSLGAAVRRSFSSWRGKNSGHGCDDNLKPRQREVEPPESLRSQGARQVVVPNTEGSTQLRLVVVVSGWDREKKNLEADNVWQR
jgi:hypothetical protein